ncbi:sensor histidine kinase [Streptomyces sp. NPDC050161]|uniref:sensor histidine kinase n=1 Tax=Streptomyces sp. NPDC050161 TaxID=3365604 RepID=UPI0037AD9985
MISAAGLRHPARSAHHHLRRAAAKAGRSGQRVRQVGPGAGPGGRYRRAVRFLDNRRHWLSWWNGKFRSLGWDLLVTALAVWTGSSSDTVPTVWACVLVAPAFLVRRRFPWAAVLVTVPVAFLTQPTGPAMIAAYTAGMKWGPQQRSWVAGGLTCTVAFCHTAHTLGLTHTASYLVGFAVAAVAGAMLAGQWVFQRRVLLATLHGRAEQAERERDLLAERAVAAERRRIAREMHDVVAHRVSIITIQAGGLSVTAPDARTGEVAEVIRRTGATALSELRGMLRVLRDDKDGTAAQDGDDAVGEVTVRGIKTLVDDVIASGATIRLEMPDDLPQPSGAVDRAAYRVVQEALTNAAKHAPHATVDVTVTAEDSDLMISVANERGGGPDSGGVPGSGYGLIGMRERITLAGGALGTGWEDDGKYWVRAVFPLHAQEDSA